MGINQKAEKVREQIRFLDAKPAMRGILEDLVDLIDAQEEESLNTENRALVLGQENDRLRREVARLHAEGRIHQQDAEKLDHWRDMVKRFADRLDRAEQERDRLREYLDLAPHPDALEPGAYRGWYAASRPKEGGR